MQNYNYSAEGKAQIPVTKLVLTTPVRYFEKYDIIKFNFSRAIVKTRPIKNEDGSFTMELTPAGIENDIAQFDTVEFVGNTVFNGYEEKGQSIST